MKIENEQQFYSFLYSKGIERRNYQSNTDIYCDIVVRSDMGIAVDYIIKMHPLELNNNVLGTALRLPFGTFKRMVNVAVKNNIINLEDLVLDYFADSSHRLCSMSDDNIIKFMFETHKVDPNGKDGMIFTEACHYGCDGVIKYLIEEKGVDPNTNDEMGFMLACRFGRFKTALYLAEHGANYKTRNSLCYKLLQKKEAIGVPGREELLKLYEGEE